MSRALNIDAEYDHVVATCTKQKAAISAIEKLLSGGTRVVLMNGEGAAAVAKVYGSKVLTGPVRRTSSTKMR